MDEGALEQGPPRPGLYPIRTLSRLTGVPAVTLRAWERRHRLLTPTRTEKGHRLYNEADVDRV
ncbi:MAG: MerR family transcriptional regulator, partial [Chromatiaceae bacterium]